MLVMMMVMMMVMIQRLFAHPDCVGDVDGDLHGYHAHDYHLVLFEYTSEGPSQVYCGDNQ